VQIGVHADSPAFVEPLTLKHAAGGNRMPALRSASDCSRTPIGMLDRVPARGASRLTCPPMSAPAAQEKYDLSVLGMRDATVRDGEHVEAISDPCLAGP